MSNHDLPVWLLSDAKLTILSISHPPTAQQIFEPDWTLSPTPGVNLEGIPPAGPLLITSVVPGKPALGRASGTFTDGYNFRPRSGIVQPEVALGLVTFRRFIRPD